MDAVANIEPDQLMDPESVAKAYWYLHTQSRDGWTLRTRPAALWGDMVMARVEFLFDFGSPNAYLAHKVIPEIEKRTGAKFEYVPVLLGGIFKLTNNKPPMIAFGDIKNKMAYEKLEMRRFIAQHKLTQFKFNPYLPGQHAGAHAQRGGGGERWACCRAMSDAVFHHMWEEPKKMDDPRGRSARRSSNRASMPIA